MRSMLRLEKIEVGRKHIITLMKKMSIEALYRKANISRRNQAPPSYYSFVAPVKPLTC